jgi:hypothetical protein
MRTGASHRGAMRSRVASGCATGPGDRWRRRTGS